MEYKLCGALTLISAILGLLFAAEASLHGTKASRTNGLYTLARSAALLLLAAAALNTGALELLKAATAVMLVVQAFDGLVEISIKSILRTAGPFFLAFCHAGCLIWMT